MPYSSIAIALRKTIHKPLMAAFRSAVNNRVKLVRDESECKQNVNPTIYAAAHVFYYDIPAICSCIADSVYILHGQEKEIKATSLIDYLGLKLNGLVSFRRDSRISRAQAVMDMATVLSNGGNILAFCEGTWNFSPNLLVLPLSWGILESVKLANREVNIVPVACDLVEGNYCTIIGKTLKYNTRDTSSKMEFMQTLRESIASLVWELYEMKTSIKRSSLPSPPDRYWLDYIHKHCAEIAIRNQYDEDQYSYKPRGEISLCDVLAEIYGLEYKSMAADYAAYRRIMMICENWTKPCITR